MKKTFLLLGLAILMMNCQNDSLLEKNDIDSKIQITPLEIPGTGSPVLGLSCKTEKIYPCFNYPILTNTSFGENKISVTFISVPDIEICLTALGPASAFIDLNNVPNGTYEIELNNGNLKNKGKLIITDTEITLNFKHQVGIDILRNTTKRTPPNTYWGTVGYHTESTSDKVNEFLNILKNMDGVTAFNNQSPGVYSFYQINQKGEIIPSSLSGYHYVKYFIFQFNGADKETFNNEIDLLASSYYDDMIINFENTHSDRIYNWD
jgi:hypothetical protein